MGKIKIATNRFAIEARERENSCVELRKTGMTYAEIGQELGMHPQNARNHVIRALQRLEDGTQICADALRQLELMRLDELQAGVWRAATSGDLDALNAVLKIMNHRSKLLGIEMPVKVVQEINKRTINAHLVEVRHNYAQMDSRQLEAAYRAKIESSG